jgi:hypothetical protein
MARRWRDWAAVFVAACRGGSARLFSDAERLTNPLSALSSAVALKQQFHMLHGCVAMLETALDFDAAGVILLDQHRRVIHANAAGEALLRRADILFVTASGLCVTTAQGNERRP